MEMRNRDKTWVDPEALAPGSVLYARTSYDVECGPHFGGDVSRKVFVSTPNEWVTPDQVVRNQITWIDLLGPIRSWEAWQMAMTSSMAYQGIEYVHPDGSRFRIYLDDPHDVTSMRFGVEEKDVLDDLTFLAESVKKSLAHHLYDQADRITAGNKNLDDADVSLNLLIGEELIEEPLAGLGWRVADVWRLKMKDLRIQAKQFGLKKGDYLLNRLKRREAASLRHAK
jgi:hypothetical protein